MERKGGKAARLSAGSGFRTCADRIIDRMYDGSGMSPVGDTDSRVRALYARDGRRPTAAEWHEAVRREISGEAVERTAEMLEGSTYGDWALVAGRTAAEWPSNMLHGQFADPELTACRIAGAAVSLRIAEARRRPEGVE